MEYEVGQKVRIKPFEWFKERGYEIDPDYCGKEATIIGNNNCIYVLDIYPEAWFGSVCFDPILQ